MSNPNIAVVVPTIREESIKKWIAAWFPLLKRHDCRLIIVHDGDDPRVQEHSFDLDGKMFSSCSGFLLRNEWFLHIRNLIVTRSPAIRNLGFWCALQKPVDFIYTLDDDCYPVEGTDPIQDHIDTLNGSCGPQSREWQTTCTPFPRGLPYGIRSRQEFQIVVSHGVWSNVLDLDAPTQLVNGTSDKNASYWKGIIPWRTYFPFCGMNVMLRPKVLPYAYWAPVKLLPGAERFDDIWCGLWLKDHCDMHGWAIASGYSIIKHIRESNVFKNLQQEALGIEINETYWKDRTQSNAPKIVQDFLKKYDTMRVQWQQLLTEKLRGVECS